MDFLDALNNVEKVFLGVYILGIPVLCYLVKKASVKPSVPSLGEATYDGELGELVSELRQRYPHSCRVCDATGTNPDFILGESEEEECPACYAKGYDPYDITKKLEKQGEYKVSTVVHLDPLYRGYVLLGGKILALKEKNHC